MVASRFVVLRSIDLRISVVVSIKYRHSTAEMVQFPEIGETHSTRIEGGDVWSHADSEASVVDSISGCHDLVLVRKCFAENLK